MANVAHLVRAPGCGSGGGGFNPRHSPHRNRTAVGRPISMGKLAFTRMSKRKSKFICDTPIIPPPQPIIPQKTNPKINFLRNEGVQPKLHPRALFLFSFALPSSALPSRQGLDRRSNIAGCRRASCCAWLPRGTLREETFSRRGIALHSASSPHQ